MQSLVVAEVSEAAVPLGDIGGAVAENLALHLGGRQARLDRLFFPIDQHHRVPAGAVCRRLTGVVGAQLAHTFQTCNTTHYSRWLDNFFHRHFPAQHKVFNLFVTLDMYHSQTFMASSLELFRSRMLLLCKEVHALKCLEVEEPE